MDDEQNFAPTPPLVLPLVLPPLVPLVLPPLLLLLLLLLSIGVNSMRANNRNGLQQFPVPCFGFCLVLTATNCKKLLQAAWTVK